MNRAGHWIRVLLLALATVCLGLGLLLPVIRFDTLYFFSEEPSLIELVAALIQNGDVLLALLVGLFSIAFPVLKLMAIAVQLTEGKGRRRIDRVMPHLSKWSMMDVMLVAIVIFAAKSSGIATAAAQPGLWFYAASALLAGILQGLVPAKRKGQLKN